jgi:multidrug efflux pump subunit AcrB
MQLAKIAVENKAVTYFALLLILVVGTASYFQLGQLEDPDFTVKTAMVVTQYPGASPKEVELEVTDRIETAIQKLPQLRFLTSYSHAGLSIIKVEIKQEYWADRLPQVWDEMRSKIRDVRATFPPGVKAPNVFDDFSFVYGFVLAVTGEGFSYAKLEDYVKSIKKELSLIPGVARVELWGAQPRVIYLDASEQKLTDLGISAENFLATLQTQNLVVDAGSLEIGDRRLRIAPSGQFRQPQDIGELKIRTSLLDKLGDIPADLAGARNPVKRSSQFISLKDLATVRLGYLEPPLTQMRYDGQPAIGIAIANVTGGNIVDTGKGLDRKIQEIVADLPIGIELHRVAWQSDLVVQAIGDFMINLAEAVLIVMVVLTLVMGWRMGVIIGGALILTILGTFAVMAAMKIDLQRISLGALIIALGMMVDNAIVVADGMVTRLKKGMDRVEAAIEAASQPSASLMGATIIAVMAFYPIYSAKADAGEYAASLFVVVGISLLVSWVIALTITPVMCIDLVAAPKETSEKGADSDSGGVFKVFRNALEHAIRLRWATIGCMVGLLAVSVYGFQFVDRLFFTDASRQQFMIDVWAPEGTKIQEVASLIEPIEARLGKDDKVESVSSFIGSGGPRFYLPLDPELPYASYAQLIVNTKSLDDVDTLIADLEPWVKDAVPQALIRLRKYTAGPGNTWQFEARFSGPAEADPNTLRGLARQGQQILQASPYAKHVRTDMRQRVLKLVPEYDQETGRWTGTSRSDIGHATRFGYDGLPVGLYREGDNLYPIIVRRVEEERRRLSDDLDLLQVMPSLSVKSIPLSAVTTGINIEMEDPTIVRWNRRRAVTVQASPSGVTFPTLFDEVRPAFEAIKLPPGYKLEWRGEYFSTKDSQESLKPGAAPSLIIVLFIIVALFNAFRPPLIILLMVPFALIGITGGLLGFGQPFSFMALLGAMSLFGMMIRNAIVIIDEFNLNMEHGSTPYDAVVDGAVSRLRPVVLAAATTVLGVLPLVQDIFWVAMAVTISAGLTFGTIVTMFLLPVVYATFYKIRAPK